MKVKTIVRSAEEATRERSGDLRKVHRNLDPALRPLERATEAKRALNAVKLDRVFAKPFVAAFGHDDGVTALARSPARLNALVSGCADGTLSVWDLAGRRKLRRLVGHAAAIQGVSVSASGDALVSCSADGAIRMFRLPFAPPEPGSVVSTSEFSSAVRGGGDAASSSVVDAAAVAEFDGGGGGLSSVDHHPRSRGVFATGGGAGVAVWDAARSRSAPVQRLEWGADGVRAVRFNPAEPSLLVAAGGADRAVVLFDVRASTPVRKLVMQTRATAAAWNPIEPFNLVAASEDTNLYSFDARMFSKGATCVHQDFVSAVTSVDWSPTGREFVAGGYDRSVRIFGARAVSRFFFFLFGFLVFEVRKRRERKKRKNSSFFFWSRLSLTRALFFSPLSLSFPLSLFPIPPPPPPPKQNKKHHQGHSREVYTLKRMQRVAAVCFSGDGAYVVSGSDDANVRLWKARASEKMGVRLSRELHASAYSSALVERYRHLPEVRRIERHRKLPGAIVKAAKARRVQIDSEARKNRSRVRHSAPGTVVVKPERRRKIVAEVE